MNRNTATRHKRVQESVLAPAESAALQWFAKGMPAWVSSDHLTLLGLLSMFFAGLFYCLSASNPTLLHAVNLMIFLNWFGDSLDGTLARYRKRLRPRYGYYVDHIIDNFGVLFLLTGLGFSGFMSPWIAVAVLVAYLLLNINIYLATSAIGVFQISFWKMGPTELRLALIVGNLFLITRPWVTFAGHPLLLFDIGGAVATGVMVIILVVTTILNTRKLYCLDRI